MPLDFIPGNAVTRKPAVKSAKPQAQHSVVFVSE